MIAPFNFSSFQDQILLTNDAGKYVFLSNDEFGNFVSENGKLKNDVQETLKEEGFFWQESGETFFRANAEAIREANGYLFGSTSLFILAITNECNNRCVYCQANGNRESQHMNIQVAEQILERIKETPATNITIEFQGGEPLMNFPVIQYVVEHGKKVLKAKNVQYVVVSNLQLLTKEIADFFSYKQISVSTSLDGPEFLHELNRPSVTGLGSYRSVIRGVELLRSKGIIPGAIQTTTRKSLAYAQTIVDEYVRLGFQQIFLRPLTRLGAASRCWEEIGYSSEEFILFYRTALKQILWYNRQGIQIREYYACLFLSRILYGRSTNFMDLRSPCGAGIGQIAITANGNVYTCDEGRMLAETGDEAFCIGNVFTGNYRDWIKSSCCQATSAASLLDSLPGCCDCVFKPYCGVCPVINYALYGNVTHVSTERCKIFKGILTAIFELLKDGDDEIMAILEKWGKQA